MFRFTNCILILIYPTLPQTKECLAYVFASETYV